ncbi:hypothetical protein EWM64_g7602 [Hericium alpestre]|uniref:Uncharacterized protein n=1 Tax=Hericium alpestre TaxID=135208 RepID=A0A4Y9ZRH3_9AGAM|nr:hypothetical protein EWM64_g7602 [Hericium alpestre]
MSTTSSDFPTESPSPSIDPNDSNNNGRNSTTVMLFGFIVVVVIVLAVFLVGGLLWHRIRQRRYGDMVGIERYTEETGHFRGGPPPMYEVWAADEKVGGKGEWATLQPLAVNVERSPSQASHIEPPERKHRSWFSHALSPRSDRGHDASDDDAPPVSVDAVHVSFLVAMPSPDRHPSKDARFSMASDISSRPWSQSGEYAIGTYHTPFRGHAGL